MIFILMTVICKKEYRILLHDSVTGQHWTDLEIEAMM